MLRCCNGPLVAPNQASLETLTIQAGAAPLAVAPSRVKPGKQALVADQRLHRRKPRRGDRPRPGTGREVVAHVHQLLDPQRREPAVQRHELAERAPGGACRRARSPRGPRPAAEGDQAVVDPLRALRPPAEAVAADQQGLAGLQSAR